MTKPTEVKFHPPLTDIPARLRYLADQQENEPDALVFGKARIAIVTMVDQNDEIQTVAFGDVGRSVEVEGWLVRALIALRNPL